MKIISASFFWRNDEPGGLGFTLRSPAFAPEELTNAFSDEAVAEYFRDSDAALGSNVVATYLDQLADLGRKARKDPLRLQECILAALNIMWLTERGFIPQDEFNGPLFVRIT